MSSRLVLNSHNIDVCVSMYCSVFNEEPWEDGWTEQAARERLSTFTKIPRFDGLALMVDDVPKAMILGWGERLASGWVFLIKEMCVHADCRRTGVGSELMAEFESRLIEKSYAGAYLETLVAGPSTEFYETVGFKKIPLVMLSKRFV